MTATVEESDADVLPNMYRAQWIAAAASLVVIAQAALFYLASDAAAWTGGVGAALVVFGLFGPHRGGFSGGVILLAIGSLVATDGMSLTASLVVNGCSAVAFVAVLVLTDLSFSARRATVMAPITVQGFALVHIVTTAVGVLAAAGAVAAVQAVEWPRWLVVVPAAVLAISAVVLIQMVRRYRASVVVVPQPPAPEGTPLSGTVPPILPNTARKIRANVPQPPPPNMAAARQHQQPPPPPPPPPSRR